MRKAIIRLRQDISATFSEIQSHFIQAWRTGEYQEEVFEFQSPIALFRLLSVERWELLDCLQTLGAQTFIELSKQLENKNLQQDITALQEIGLLETTTDNKFYVPFVEIHADFILRQAA